MREDGVGGVAGSAGGAARRRGLPLSLVILRYFAYVLAATLDVYKRQPLK